MKYIQALTVTVGARGYKSTAVLEGGLRSLSALLKRLNFFIAAAATSKALTVKYIYIYFTSIVYIIGIHMK